MITALGFDVVMCDSDNVFVSDPFASGAPTRTWILLLEFSLLSLRMCGERGKPSRAALELQLLKAAENFLNNHFISMVGNTT